jgi:hypothetical protein
VRRVSVSRGELALARAWSVARWRAWRGPARRPEQVGEMLAAKGRAGGAASRTALLRPAETAPTEDKPSPTPTTKPTPKAAPAPAPEPAAPLAEPPASADTIARLREAKQRARDRETRDHS